MVCDGCNCYLLFLPFYPPLHTPPPTLAPPPPLPALNIKIFMKIKKTHGDIIILHMYNKNYDQMMYDFRQTDRQKK